MSRGLDLIIEKIRANPSQTLVHRFLALISELPDEAEKSQHALDLAEVLLQQKPTEALHIAHMVFRSNRASKRALDVMIRCLEAKGRYAKAEVLRIEQAKLGLTGELSAEGEASIESALHAGAEADQADAAEGDAHVVADLADRKANLVVKVRDRVRAEDQIAKVLVHAAEARGNRIAKVAPRPSAPLTPEPAFGEEVENSRIAELDLGELPELTNGSAAVDRLFPPDSPAGAQAVDDGMPRPSRLQGLRGLPGDTVLPFSAGRISNSPRPTIRVDGDAVLASAVPTPVREPRPIPLVQTAATPAVSELFDYYWRQGFASEAREILRQSAAASSHEAWWQARHALVEKSREAPPATVTREPAGGPRSLHSLEAELVRLARAAKDLTAPRARTEQLLALARSGRAARPLPPALVEALATLDHRLPGMDATQILALKWELFQALWGATPDPVLSSLLPELGLADATPGFFGLYLDALLVGGSARRALMEIRQVLGEHPQLVWARVAFVRLPIVWRLLAVRGFEWSEDEGVPALLISLARRPRPRLAALAALGRSR